MVFGPSSSLHVYIYLSHSLARLIKGHSRSEEALIIKSRWILAPSNLIDACSGLVLAITIYLHQTWNYVDAKLKMVRFWERIQKTAENFCFSENDNNLYLFHFFIAPICTLDFSLHFFLLNSLQFSLYYQIYLWCGCAKSIKSSEMDRNIQ